MAARTSLLGIARAIITMDTRQFQNGVREAQMAMRRLEASARRNAEMFENWQQSWQMLGQFLTLLGLIPPALVAIGVALGKLNEERKISMLQMQTELDLTDEQIDKLEDMQDKIRGKGLSRNREEIKSIQMELLRQNEAYRNDLELLQKDAELLLALGEGSDMDPTELYKTLLEIKETWKTKNLEDAYDIFITGVKEVNGLKEEMGNIVKKYGKEIENSGMSTQEFINIGQMAEDADVDSIEQAYDSVLGFFNDRIAMDNKLVYGHLLTTMKALGDPDFDIYSFIKNELEGQDAETRRKRTEKLIYGKIYEKTKKDEYLAQRLADDLFGGNINGEFLLKYAKAKSEGRAYQEVKMRKGVAQEVKKDLEEIKTISAFINTIVDKIVVGIGEPVSRFFAENQDLIQEFFVWLDDVLAKFGEWIDELSKFAKEDPEGFKNMVKLNALIIGLGIALPLIAGAFYIMNSSMLVFFTSANNLIGVLTKLNGKFRILKGIFTAAPEAGGATGMARFIQNLSKASKTLFPVLSRMLPFLTRFLGIVGLIITAIQTNFLGTGDRFSGWLKNMGEQFKLLGDLFSVLFDFPDNAEEAKEYFGKIAEIIGEMIGNGLTWVIEDLATSVEALFSSANWLGEKLAEFGTWVAEMLWLAIFEPEEFKKKWNEMLEKIHWEDIKAVFVAIGDGFMDGLGKGIDKGKYKMLNKIADMLIEVQAFFDRTFVNIIKSWTFVIDQIAKATGKATLGDYLEDMYYQNRPDAMGDWKKSLRQEEFGYQMQAQQNNYFNTNLTPSEVGAVSMVVSGNLSRDLLYRTRKS